MKQSNVDKLTLDIFNPKSKNYGKYWTAKQVEELVRTSPENLIKSQHGWKNIQSLNAEFKMETF